MHVLIVETAAPKRVRKKAEDLVAAGVCSASDLTILCTDDSFSLGELSTIEGARLVALPASRRRETLALLKKEEFDAVLSFWTGERKYHRMKLAALRIRSREHRIDMGDGHEFKLSRGTFLWFLRTRWKYPLPSDHFLFVTRPLTPRREEARGESAATDEFPARHLGEEVLIIQSADPPVVLRVLDRLKKRPLFMNPRYTLFCRNLPGVAERFCDHPMLYRVISHNETRGAFAHLASLRRENFDAVVVFFTGDPSYWKIKFLPFLLGARHKLIFNENDDCFFFSWRSWQAHMSRRLAESVEAAPAPRVHFQLRSLAIVVVKLILFPFRLAWLLLVWLRLRSSEIRLSG